MAERLSLLGQVQLEVIDADRIGGWALVEAIARGSGASSGAPVRLREYFLIAIDDEGLIVHWREFLDRDAALDAARER